MRVAVVGPSSEHLLRQISAAGLVETTVNPEVVISHGGDGTLLAAERRFPGLPKVPIRPSDHARICPLHTEGTILGRLAHHELAEQRFLKVEALVGGHTILALNETGIHAADPATAIRFRLFVNGREYVDGDIIGDGLLVAAPFGSSAYFYSVTRGTFRQGLGLAIINSVEPLAWAVLAETDSIEALVTRGRAVVMADNDPTHPPISDGEHVTYRASPDRSVILGLDALACQDCQPVGRRYNAPR